MSSTTGTRTGPTFKKPKPLPTIPPYGDNAIDIQNLTFTYASTSRGSTLDNQGDEEMNMVLQEMFLQLETGSRCLLIGANGSGKSTLLRILAGRHLTSASTSGDGVAPASCKVLGLHAFHDTKLNFHRAYLDCDWGMRNVAFVGAAVPLMADIAVANMMEKLQASYPERRDELLDLLGIDLNWRMHQLSDGQRRRVQIFLGLIRPFKCLFLDEITTSLDVVVRLDLLKWLVRESETRKATIIYATHIFDGLDDWASHLYYLTDEGKCGWQGRMGDLELYQKLQRDQHPCKMLAIAEHWLRAEAERKKLTKSKEKPQGAAAHAADPTKNQGGYSSGRGVKQIPVTTMAPKVAAVEQNQRQGRLSDIMGNSGVLSKVRRVAGETSTSQ